VKLVTHAFLWLFLYTFLALAPLLAALVGDAPDARGTWTELSVALGFVGLAVLGLQFAVTARSNGVDAPYGLDVVLRFHRQMSFVGFGLVLAHPLVLFVTGAADWTLLNVVDAPWRARFGVLSLAALLGILATSLWRLQLRLSYEVWRLLHGLLAVVVMVGALAHVEAVGHYVSGPWRRTLWAVMSLAVVALLAWVRVVKPVLLLRRPWVVDDVIPRADDVWSLVLRPDGHDGFRFQPGQFVWITLGRSPLRITEHPFSISSSAERRDAVELTIKASGDFTSRIGEVDRGTRAHLDGPYGVFTYERNQAPAFLFVAGGIGITPILSMLRTLADVGDRRRMTLVYANPTLDEAVFSDELDSLARRLELRVVHVPQEAPPGWDGPSGFVDASLLADVLPDRADRVEAFVCGPPPMMAAMADALDEIGVGSDRVTNERFDLI